MAKSSKKSKETAAADPATNYQNGDGATRPNKPAPAKTATAKAAKKTGSKPRATKPRKQTAAASRARPAGDISDDEIRIRAYFISQHRMRENLPGNSADDWLEARRQLEAEASRRAYQPSDRR
jgi:hypothetical protein